MVRRKSNTIYCKLKRISAVPSLFHSFWFFVFVVFVVVAHNIAFHVSLLLLILRLFPFLTQFLSSLRPCSFQSRHRKAHLSPLSPKRQDRAAPKTRPIPLFLNRCSTPATCFSLSFSLLASPVLSSTRTHLSQVALVRTSIFSILSFQNMAKMETYRLDWCRRMSTYSSHIHFSLPLKPRRSALPRQY